MKTVEYKLKTLPGKSIKLPEEYFENAENLIQDLEKLKKINEVIPTLDREPDDYNFDSRMYSNGFRFFESLPESPKKQKATDLFYILVGMREIDKTKRSIFHIKKNMIYRNLQNYLDKLS